MKRIGSSFLVSTLIAAVVTATACTTDDAARRGSDRTVVIDGVTLDVDDVAAQQFQRALDLRDAGRVDEAQQELEQLLALYADAAVAHRAKLALAQIHLDKKEPKHAQQLLERLLLEQPSSGVADQARYLLALAQIAQGEMNTSAPKELARYVEKQGSSADKVKTSLELYRQLREQRQHGEAVRYLHRAIALMPEGEEKARYSEDLLNAIDRDLSFVDVRRLIETEAQPDTLLDSYLLLKLARIHLHLGDLSDADERLNTYLQRYPSAPFAGSARELRGRLKTRVVVDARSVGVVLPLSGQYAVYGQRALTSVLLGFGVEVKRDAYQAEEGKVAGPGIYRSPATKERPAYRIIVIDSGGDETVARQGVRRLVEDEHVIGIIGDILIDTSLPVAVMAEDYRVPVISLSRRAGLTDVGSWAFRMAFTPTKQAQALAELAADVMGKRNFGVLYPDHSYGLELTNAFWDELDERQLSVTAVERYAHDQTTFTVEAKRLVGRLNVEARYEFNICKNAAKKLTDPYRKRKALSRCSEDVSPIVDFDALLLPDTWNTVSYVVPALIAEDILVTTDKITVEAYKKTIKQGRVRHVQLFGGAPWNNKHLGQRFEKQRVESPIFVDSFWPDDQRALVQDFVKRYAQVHRSAPSDMDAHAYDAAAVLRGVLAGAQGQSPTSRSALRDMLSDVQGFPGVTGFVGFDETGDSSTPPRFFRFEDGAFSLVEPKDLRVGEG